jgi:hypothetical protein
MHVDKIIQELFCMEHISSLFQRQYNCHSEVLENEIERLKVVSLKLDI